MFVRLCVRMSIFLDVSVECACASFCASNCSLSAGGKYSSHFSSADANLGTSLTASAFSLSFPHSFFNLPLRSSGSGNKALQDVQPSKKKECLTFHHLSLACLFSFNHTPISSSFWSSTRVVRNYFLIFRSWVFSCNIAGGWRGMLFCTCGPVFKCEETGLLQRKLTMWRLPSWWSVYRMNKKDNLCSQSGRIAQTEPPRTNHRTLITEVPQQPSSSTHEDGHLMTPQHGVITTTRNEFNTTLQMSLKLVTLQITSCYITELFSSSLW